MKHFRYFRLENGCYLMKKGVLTWWWESKRTLQWQLGGCWHFLLLRCMRLSSSEDMRGGRTATTTSVHQCPRVPAYEEAWGSSKHRVVLVELRKPDFSSLPSFLKKSCPDNNLWLFYARLVFCLASFLHDLWGFFFKSAFKKVFKTATQTRLEFFYTMFWNKYSITHFSN